MELKNLSKEELREYSFIEITHYLLVDRHEPMTFEQMLEEWKTLLGFTDKEVKARMVQFYTDLNMDGRFIALGENRWGLRTWYPLDQAEDEHITSAIKAKKKKKKVLADDLDYDDLDDDEDLEFDELDEDLVDEDDDEDNDEDFDEDLIEEDEFDLDEDDDEDEDEDDLDNDKDDLK
ncbi:DNA-directed RNA polymerase subunit delta [Jeotgalibacillus soli]|uniref:Probable DNA-directed RNA polymerase subunit delta n=1 Tax=Jeotgalibacillus soli TaxID=889306 RepID=A0A0C2VZC1_9BACL|nr:DNA-directed RNA polymerase subunit delta [Jeotgalibacillus soli]KIL49736.1 DNA-directed RNA polymerase subunit delta [Jeotgalibacillus soli]